MATQATANELVRSNEEIQSAVAEADAAESEPLDPEPDGLDADADADDTGRRPWETPGEDEEALADDPTASTRSKGASTVREYKANGKTHKVDVSDQAAVDRLISLGLGARPVFTERDKLKKDVQSRDTQIADLQRYKANWDKLESAKSNKAALYEKIFGSKWADDVKAESDWQARYNLASPEEKRWMDGQRQMEADKAQAVADRATHEAERAKLDQERDGLKMDRIKGTMVPEFQRYEFSTKVKDEATAARLNKALWKLAISELKEHYGDKDDIPPSAVRQAFRDTHDMLWGQHKQAATQEVNKVVADKKKTAKEQAQLASTRNYGGDKSAKPMPTDPVKLFRRMFK